MKKFIIALSFLLLAVGFSGMAGATTIDFDGYGNNTTALTTYNDLSFSYLGSNNLIKNNYHNSTPNSLFMGKSTTELNAGVSITVADGYLFDFDSAYFAKQCASELTITGFSGDAQVYNSPFTFTLNSTKGIFTIFGTDITGIDRLVISGTASFFMDDFTYDVYAKQSTSNPVPEPATMLLLGSGLVGLGGFRKRFFKK
jgi:hypothetical protein